MVVCIHDINIINAIITRGFALRFFGITRTSRQSSSHSTQHLGFYTLFQIGDLNARFCSNYIFKSFESSFQFALYTYVNYIT